MEATEEMRRLAVRIGVCPYCKRNLSDVRTDGTSRWRHCFECHFNFDCEEESTCANGTASTGS